ncbi:MAG: hypothetical protein ACRDJ9_36005, partial [Dehalococcoidia bacterium]
AVLYSVGGHFRCRGCHDLAYSSTRESASDRTRRKADKVRKRLGVEGKGRGFGPIPKPPRMHWRTHRRLVGELLECELEAISLQSLDAERFLARLDRSMARRRR